ncbi:MAG TPA: chorismate-binding protein [Thermoanaerobaculia bacterium]|nr:chorismate-binding protein [Thermoanaerobaculia bacterium]
MTPHVREFLADTLTPLGVYRRLRSLSPVCFLFESVTGGERVSRYSFLGAAPRELLAVYLDRVERLRDGGGEVLPGAPLEALRRELGRFRGRRGPIPFTGGWVGFFGFDLVRLVERLPPATAAGDGLPVAVLGRFDEVVVFDHAHQRVLAVANEVAGEVDRGAAEAALERLGRTLTAGAAGGGVELPAALPSPPRPESVSLDGPAFRQAVDTVKQHVAAGDVFQVVLARRFSVASAADPLSLYRALRLVNPSPYMVLLELPQAALVGASPEMLVRVTAGRLETRPIAGTRRRGATPEEDDHLAGELLADAKERAEHLMLVDLGRNDLGRVAAAGSVRLASFMEVERYSHVMHLVSSVEGELAPGRDALDALLACFPAGTVSGAPKVRAMEILGELEPEGRGPYAGAVGYLSFSGDLDTCITIRTLVAAGGVAAVTAGAGIVADSDPAREEQETVSKAAAVLAAVALAEALAPAEGPMPRGGSA